MKKKLNLARLDEKQQESVKAGERPLRPCEEFSCPCNRVGYCYPSMYVVDSGAYLPCGG